MNFAGFTKALSRILQGLHSEPEPISFFKGLPMGGTGLLPALCGFSVLRCCFTRCESNYPFDCCDFQPFPLVRGSGWIRHENRFPFRLFDSVDSGIPSLFKVEFLTTYPEARCTGKVAILGTEMGSLVFGGWLYRICRA